MARRGRKYRQEQSRKAQERERASIGSTKGNLSQIGTSVDPDILAYAMAQAERMGQSSQQAALEAARMQQLRDSGKNVKISDSGLGYTW